MFTEGRAFYFDGCAATHAATASRRLPAAAIDEEMIWDDGRRLRAILRDGFSSALFIIVIFSIFSLVDLLYAAKKPYAAPHLLPVALSLDIMPHSRRHAFNIRHI